jgi:hypothetical protein
MLPAMTLTVENPGYQKRLVIALEKVYTVSAEGVGYFTYQ